jgi:hypothetical protein
MKKYDDNRNYCGPDNWLGRLAPRKVFGVEFNCCCFDHDNDYAEMDRRKLADDRFLRCMKSSIRSTHQPFVSIKSTVCFVGAMVVAYGYYALVRIGGSSFINKAGRSKLYRRLVDKIDKIRGM